MKIAVQLVVLSGLIPSAFASGKVIYGEDNRLEVYEAPSNHQEWARSAATMVGTENISPNPDIPGMLQLKQTSLGQWLEDMSKSKPMSLLNPKALEAQKAGVKFCEDTRFISQPNPGMCSGFLIGPDLLVTAGHCVVSGNFCADYKWVFDFSVDQKTQSAGKSVNPDDVYGCKKVVSSGLNNYFGLDYAVVQLDRVVKGRKPLEIRTSQKIEDKSPLVVIGSPSGLPLKIAAGSNVRKNMHPGFFVANLDTFQGNSGSAVFNADTGVVEGILVRGEEDYRFSPARGCIEAYSCEESSCRGEDVSRIQSIPEVAVKNILVGAAKAGDLEKIKEIVKLKTWIDFNGTDGRTALMEAVSAGKIEAAKLLIVSGASVNTQDAEGNSPLHLSVSLGKAGLDVTNALLESKPDLSLRNADGLTARDLARKLKNRKASRAIKRASRIK